MDGGGQKGDQDLIPNVSKDSDKDPPVEQDPEFRPFVLLCGFKRKNPTFCCTFCTREFSSAGALEAHQRQCKRISEQEVLQDGDIFICPRCFRTFALKVVCVSHVHTHDDRAKEWEARRKEKKADSSPPSEPLQCPECPKKLASHRYLNRHVQMHIDIRAGTYRCKICSQDFRGNKELTDHSLAAHGKFQMVGGPAQPNPLFDKLLKNVSFRSKARKHWQRSKFKND